MCYGYNPLVMVGPLLFQILYEAGDFPVQLNHHPVLEKRQQDGVRLSALMILPCNSSVHLED